MMQRYILKNGINKSTWNPTKCLSNLQEHRKEKQDWESWQTNKKQISKVIDLNLNTSIIILNLKSKDTNKRKILTELIKITLFNYMLFLQKLGGGIKENDGGVNSMIYLIYCKNFCKCHNVSPPSKTIIKEKKKNFKLRIFICNYFQTLMYIFLLGLILILITKVMLI
jgi:hypothetical protein